jgi:hypothetical protein
LPNRQGAEVSQLYLTYPSTAQQPFKQLRGFVKTTLQPGARQVVTFDALTDRWLSNWCVRPMLGSASVAHWLALNLHQLSLTLCVSPSVSLSLSLSLSRVSLSLAPAWARRDTASHSWKLTKGEFVVGVGGSSDSLPLRGKLTV